MPTDNIHPELIQRAKRDKSEFRHVYLQYASKVFNYVWYRVGQNKPVAEDLTQETFLRAFEHLPGYTLRGYSYLTYLITIARNLLTNHFRKQAPISLEEAHFLVMNTSDDVEQRILIERVWEKASLLNQAEQTVLRLKYQKDWPVAKIAQVMHKSENAVKLLLSRSRKKIRREFKKELERDTTQRRKPKYSLSKP